jgi:hypothetical protein
MSSNFTTVSFQALVSVSLEAKSKNSYGTRRRGEEDEKIMMRCMIVDQQGRGAM